VEGEGGDNNIVHLGEGERRPTAGGRGREEF